MDELMKNVVMNADENTFFIDEDTKTVFYRISGVENYFLRYDGKIFHYAPYTEPEYVSCLSDAIFNTFEEAKAFITFLGAYSDQMDGKPVGDDTIFYINGLDEKNKTFAGLMKYTDKIDKLRITYDVVIVAEKIAEVKTIYRIIPRTFWCSNTEPNENHHNIDISKVHTAILKPVVGLNDIYLITGGTKRTMIQITMVKSLISDNKVLRFTYHKIDNHYISSLGDYRFTSIDEVILALKVWDATGVMNYTETIKKDDGTTVEQNFIRYLDGRGNDHTLMVSMPDPKFSTPDSGITIYELIKA